MKKIVAAGLSMLALGACATDRSPAVAVGAAPSPPQPAWRTAIADDDVRRLDTLPAQWTSAWQKLGRRATVLAKGEGALLQPGTALPHPALPPGSYKCRLVTLARTEMRKAPSFFCYVGGEEGERVSFTKQTGTALPGGWLYRDEDRYVFLGAKQRQPGNNTLGYGTDRVRDLVGVVERIGPFRWRLVLPGDAFEVYELTPVPIEQQGASG